ncbi:MAG TPA: hypothetical protein VF620_07665 [Allosphingosinicella sp.]|jgi:hypothetical protein
MSKMFALPAFLKGRVTQEAYSRWLGRKAAAHVKRDRLRSLHEITGSHYRQQIHSAVCESGGTDFYTGEPLAWEKLSTYCNEDSKAGRSAYKAGFALLPTADHVLLEDGSYDFVICGWRTNDAKNDLCHAEFIKLCRQVIAHHENRTGAAFVERAVAGGPEPGPSNFSAATGFGAAEE